MMQVWKVASLTPKPALSPSVAAKPKPAPGEVLIEVLAAGVTPSELRWYPTSHFKDGAPRPGAVPSHEFSGRVAELGEGAAGFTQGQEIYGMNDWFAEGALAEYCITRPEWIAPKPRNLGFPEAASAPIGALTAWQGLFDRARLQPGERVLIHGGAGGVGVFAIQLAHRHGARVIATVSGAHAAFVREIGADEVIPYRIAPFEREARDIDVVFDAVGGETLHRSWSVLKPGGRLVTIAADAEGTDEQRVRDSFFIVEPDGARLAQISGLFERGELRPVVDTVAPFSEANDAYTGTLTRAGRGKLVVAIQNAAA